MKKLVINFIFNNGWECKKSDEELIYWFYAVFVLYFFSNSLVGFIPKVISPRNNKPLFGSQIFSILI